MEKRKPTVPYPLRPVPLARVPPGEAFGVPDRQDQARSWERRRPCPPLPLEGAAEPAFLRLRNERERRRVRCVNEGYARLRDRLPRELAARRLSKVETLRAAIGYIRDLQELLERHARARDSPAGAAPQRRADCNSDGESKASSAPSPCSEPEDGAS
ncbi:achaete-scute homolog 4 [Dipodomys spectabilis]|uniref:achaete-scute homolog 4 n=1 Tax=Dipodomys spectabilis TaxID=105255 RepID=UPI001C53FA45|nr:achaete-scute homolog 4 [Dipodomys spectabilis]